MYVHSVACYMMISHSEVRPIYHVWTFCCLLYDDIPHCSKAHVCPSTACCTMKTCPGDVLLTDKSDYALCSIIGNICSPITTYMWIDIYVPSHSQLWGNYWLNDCLKCVETCKFTCANGTDFLWPVTFFILLSFCHADFEVKWTLLLCIS